MSEPAADDVIVDGAHRLHRRVGRRRTHEPEAQLLQGPAQLRGFGGLDGNLVTLTSAEFDLLWLLVANAGRILSREEIFIALRGIGYDGQDRSIDVRISRIRPKIGDDPIHPRLIKTIRSKGYLFVPEAAVDMSQ